MTTLAVAASAVATFIVVSVSNATDDGPEPGPPARSAATEPAVAGAPEDAVLLWSDEFDGDHVDTTVWEPYHSSYGHGNNELQCHTPDNVEVGGGELVITAHREERVCAAGRRRSFTSGFLGTRETGTYFPRFGRFEIRAKLPHGQGLWPAFWLRHRDGAVTAEVDVMEYFHAQVPGRTTATVHLDGRRNASKANVPFEAPTDEPGWHTWAVDIEPVDEGVAFTFHLDGERVHHFVDEDPVWSTAHPGEPLWDLAVNLSVGGDWAGHPDDPPGYLAATRACATGGTPPHECHAVDVRRADFPAELVVDHIRVYRLTDHTSD